MRNSSSSRTNAQSRKSSQNRGDNDERPPAKKSHLGKSSNSDENPSQLPTKPNLKQKLDEVLNLLRARNGGDSSRRLNDESRPEEIGRLNPPSPDDLWSSQNGKFVERLHYNGPSVSKKLWNELGDLVSSRERVESLFTHNAGSGKIDGSRWFSLRLDGSGFSKTMKALRSMKVIRESGFSPVIANVMQHVTEKLMRQFGCILGYTQSDEIILFVAAKGVDTKTGEQKQHDRNGRMVKIGSLAAGYASTTFVLQLLAECGKEKLSENLEKLMQVSPHFDCRIGSWDGWDEARALLLWRAYDCSVNGVSDAVYQAPEAKKAKDPDSGRPIMDVDRIRKLRWLAKQNKLPLPKHQAYGFLAVKRLKVKTGFNPHTRAPTKACLRPVLEGRNEPVIELFLKDSIFLEDEKLVGEKED